MKARLKASTESWGSVGDNEFHNLGIGAVDEKTSGSIERRLSVDQLAI